MKLDKLFEAMTSDGHIPCGLVVFMVGSVMHWFHPLDAVYVSFSTTVLSFLGIHAWSQAKYPGTPPDPGAQTPKV